MKPVMQSILHTTDGPPGNCFSACIASLLELPIEEVPNFAEHGYDWFIEARRWLRERGKTLVMVIVGEDTRIDSPAGVRYIVTGQSPRGPFLHSVIGERGGRIVHDPHPSGAGVGKWEDVCWILPLKEAPDA